MTKVNLLSESASDSLQPTAQFNEEEIQKARDYFNMLDYKIRNNPNIQFCVDLDEVFNYAYKRKKEATRALIRDVSYKENVDYIIVRRAARGQIGSKTDIWMTLQCFEWFIVRKNRLIFEIYRRLFRFVLDGRNNQQFINVVTIGIENKKQINKYKSESPYPEGYSSMKQILKLLGYQHLKPAQVFKILVERGLLKQIRNHIKIEKDIDIIYADDDLVRSGDVINRSDINMDTLRNQMIFKNESISDLFIKAGINLENEEFLSKHY